MADRDKEPQAWTVTSSRPVLQDRWLTVRADDCVTAAGAEISPFYVLEYPDWVQIVALDAFDHIILVEQYRHGLGAASLELPAGGMEPGDRSPIEAAARELAEETGYATQNWRYIAELSPNPASHNNRCHVLLARDVALQVTPQDDARERIRVVRLPVDEAVRLAFEGRIVQALHIASMALALGLEGRWRP